MVSGANQLKLIAADENRQRWLKRRASSGSDAIVAGLPGTDSTATHHNKEKDMSTRFIAVYGTLLSGEKNEWVAADAISRTPCMIPGKLYDTGYGYPAILAGGFDDVAEDKHR